MADAAVGPCPVSHVEWCCRDLGAATRFFEALLGWRFQRFSRHYALHVPAQGVRVGLMQRATVPPTGGLGVFVTVDDLEATLAQAEALGGGIAEAPQTIPDYGRWAHFLDPDGNRIGLFEPAG